MFVNDTQCINHFKLVLSNQHGISTKFLKQCGKYSMTAQPDYISITGLTLFPHHFCATRWVESKGVAERAKLLWEHVFKILIFGRRYQNRNNLNVTVLILLKILLMTHNCSKFRIFYLCC